MKKRIYIIILIIALIIGCIVYFIFSNKTNHSVSTTDIINTTVDTDNSDQKIEWSNYENKEIILEKSITINEEGVYNLSGSIDDGMITINTIGNVKLNLTDVTITNSNGPAIYIEQSEDTVISISGTNTLTDSSIYSSYEDEINSVIYSKDDLTFEGDGILIINANYQDGIVGKDDLKIISGNYQITSADDAIRGKDSVYILDGNFAINSNGDGIKSTNDTENDKGYVLIENGTFNIESELDGIQAETKILIKNGHFDIKTGGGSVNSSSKNDDWGKWGNTTTVDSESSKGLKSGDNLVIENGNLTFDTSDDAIHSNNYVGIKNANISINSGDDGIHADTELIIDSGTIDITKSYEGIESQKLTINGGDISLIAEDDGINVAGSNDSSAQGRPGENHYNSNSNNILTINNGAIYIDATGDGIDVNGSAYITGGNIIVDGPTNSGNGALDYDSLFEVNGGTIIASGAAGMDRSFSSSSKLYSLHIRLNEILDSSDIITIIDDNNNEIINYQSKKIYSSIVIANPNLTKGNKYTIKINNETYKIITISDNVTTVGNISMMGGRNPQPGGRR